MATKTYVPIRLLPATSKEYKKNYDSIFRKKDKGEKASSEVKNDRQTASQDSGQSEGSGAQKSCAVADFPSRGDVPGYNY